MQAEPAELYRVRHHEDGNPDFMTLAELEQAIFADVSCGGRPPNPRCPTGVWYCSNEACAAREVRVGAKFLDGTPPPRPPALRCPACGLTLHFLRYVREITLVPHTEPTTENPGRGDPTVLPPLLLERWNLLLEASGLDPALYPDRDPLPDLLRLVRLGRAFAERCGAHARPPSCRREFVRGMFQRVVLWDRGRESVVEVCGVAQSLFGDPTPFVRLAVAADPEVMVAAEEELLRPAAEKGRAQ